MLTNIVVVAPPGAYWPDFHMPLYADPDHPFFIKDVTGLEPVDAEINSRGYGILDGDFYVGSRVGKRTIVISAALNTVLGAGSVAQARDLFYGHLRPKFEATLRFEFSDRDPVTIFGIVESNGHNRFVQDPELQVSFICPKPNFLEAVQEVEGETGETDPTAVHAPYHGTAGGGWILEIEAFEETYNGDIFIERKVGPDGAYSIMEFNDVNIPMGWKFHVNTHQGQKKVQNRDMSDEEDPTFQLHTMKDPSYWMMLFAADYYFRVRTPGSPFALTWTMRYFNQFAGV